MKTGTLQWEQGFPVMKTGFSLWELTHREFPMSYTGFCFAVQLKFSEYLQNISRSESFSRFVLIVIAELKAKFEIARNATLCAT